MSMATLRVRWVGLVKLESTARLTLLFDPSLGDDTGFAAVLFVRSGRIVRATAIASTGGTH